MTGDKQAHAESQEGRDAAAHEARRRSFTEAWQAVLGTHASTEEETQALLARLVALGAMSREETARLYGEIRALVDQRRNELEDRVQKAISAAMKKLTVPTQEDVAEAAQKLAELERRVEALDDDSAPRGRTQIPVAKLARGLSRSQPKKKKRP